MTDSLSSINLVINDISNNITNPVIDLVDIPSSLTTATTNEPMIIFSNSSAVSDASSTESKDSSTININPNPIGDEDTLPPTTDHLYENYRSYNDVVQLMSKKFNTADNINSTALDIMSVYLKGQKIIHIESKIYCAVFTGRFG